MANAFALRWGKDVEKGGYVMAPFYAMQIGSDASRLAVMACCYQYTWEGIEFDLSIAEMAQRFGVKRAMLHKQFLALANEGLITMSAVSGHHTHVNMTQMVAVVNALAGGQMPIVDRPETRQKRAYIRKRNLPQLITQSTVVDATEGAQSTAVDAQSTVVDYDRAIESISLHAEKTAAVGSIGSFEQKEKCEEEETAHTPKRSAAKEAAEKREQEITEATQPYVNAYLEGRNIDQELVSKADKKRLQLVVLDALQEPKHPTPDALLRCTRWKVSNPSWQPYNLKAGLTQVLEDFPVWIGKHEPTVCGNGGNGHKPVRRRSEWDEHELEAARQADKGKTWLPAPD